MDKDFLAALIAGLVAAPHVAGAQGRADTLVVVTEVGPNMLDIHAPGANRPSYQAAWNIYDRLLTFGGKTLKDGSKMYDYASLKPELAESWQVAPDGMSVTFKLRKDAKFHDGTPVTAKDVKWSFDRAVTVGGFPTFQMKAGSLEKPEQFEVVDDYTFRVKFLRKDKLTHARHRGARARHHQLRARQEARDGAGSVGDRVDEEQRRGRWRLQARVLEAGPGDRLRPLRRLEVGPAAEDPARDRRARCPSAGNRRALLETRRRRHLLRPAAQGLRRDREGGQAQGVAHPDRELASSTSA